MALLSLALHVLIVLLALSPLLLSGEAGPALLTEGAGGAGPAGGGGGGSRGRGGSRLPVQEELRYIEVAPAPVPVPAAVVPAEPPIVPPPQVEPVPEPVVTPPPAAAPAVTPPVSSVEPGTGGGTGTDGSAGNGPGSGGGVGSGIGTGRGSGTGPGTGGGSGSIYMPFPIALYLPPQPVPAKARGATVSAVFDIDSTGKVLDVDFNGTADRGYNRRLRETLESMKFRPAVRPDGTPVRAKFAMEFALY